MFRKKKSWVRFVNLIPGVELVHPIIPISKMKVDWIKQAARDYRERKDQGSDHNAKHWSVSNCPGIMNIFQMGYIVPAPLDFIITTNDVDVDTGKFEWEASADYSHIDTKSYIDFHNSDQLRKFVAPRSDTLTSIIKVNTKWKVTMSPDIVLLQNPIPYPEHTNFSAVPGILDGRVTNAVNVQLEWHKKQGRVLVKAGTPLCHYIPVPRDLAVDLLVERVTEMDEYLDQSINYLNVSSFNRNRKMYLKKASNIITNLIKR